MPWIKKADIERAREIDIVDYLERYEAHDLVREGYGKYHLKSHDSLHISNGKWMWWSQGIGGNSALDYLIKVKDMKFVDAVSFLLGEQVLQTGMEKPVINKTAKAREPIDIPPANASSMAAVKYLCSNRGIDREIVEELIAKKDIYVTENGLNVAFVGRDPESNVKLVCQRGMYGDFKNTARNSDRKYPFALIAEANNVRNDVVHIFEAPIDALSYATLMKNTGINYKCHNLLSLCGINDKAKKERQDSTLPMAIKQYLEDRPYTKTVCLHLDNDEPGKAAAATIKILLVDKGYEVLNQPPPEGYKDCNEFLKKGPVVNAVRKEELQHDK